MALPPVPGLTLIGVVNPNVRELVTQITAKYLSLLSGEVDMDWHAPLSNMEPTDALLLKIPIHVFGSHSYEKWEGERNFKDVDLVAVAIEAAAWTENWAIPMRRAIMGEYGGQTRIVAQSLVNAQKKRGELIANILKAGKTTAKTYQGRPLFVSSGNKHFFNPNDEAVGGFYNLMTGAGAAGYPFNATNFQRAREMHRLVKDPGGKTSLGLRLTHVLGGTLMEGKFEALLKKSTILTEKIVNLDGGAQAAVAAAETNIYAGGAKALIAPELDDDPFLQANPNGQVWYSIASNGIGRPVEMMGMDGGVPKIKVFGDGDSLALSKKSVLIMGDMEMNAAAGAPQTIIRWEWDGTA